MAAASYNLASLNRTEHVKFTTYMGDGSGRDNYIILNDGGLIPAPIFKGMAPKNDYMAKHKITAPRTAQSLCKPAQCVYYPPDGSGRDGYVIKGHGGTCNEDYGRGGIDFKRNNFLRDDKNAPFATPKMNHRLLSQTAPQMQTYSNWPSKQTYQRNKSLYKQQQEQVKRLSPSVIFYKEQSRFGGTVKKRGSFFKDANPSTFDEMVHDPVALAVEEGRAKQRALSTLKATKNMSLVRQPVLSQMSKHVDTLDHQARLASKGDRNVTQKFLSSLRGGAIGQNFLVPGQMQPPRTANDVYPRGSGGRNNMFNESLGAQNKLLMDIMHKRASTKGVLSTPDRNAGNNDRTDYTVSRKASRNSGLNSPNAHTTLEFETPIKRTTSQIKKTHVTKAAYPNFAGMTPVPTTHDDAFLASAKVYKKKALDITRNQSLGAQTLPRNLDSPDRRRMDPLEYRGPNMSDCLYHTMTGFKTNGARTNLLPQEPNSPDRNFPATGIQAL